MTAALLAILCAGAVQDNETWERDLGKEAPELLSAGWIGSPVSLRAVRGNSVVLAFWNPDLYSFYDGFFQTVLGDYERYCRERNVTFISICSSMTANLRAVEKKVEQYKLKPFPTMLDAGGATTKAYNVPKGYGTWMIIIGPDGKIAYNASKGWHWTGGPNAGKYIHHTQMEACLKKSTGVLGYKEVPPEGNHAAHLFDLQQFSMVEAELKRFNGPKATEAEKEFAAHTLNQIAETRKKRLSEVEALQAEHPIQAYREAVAFVGAFGASPEKTAMNAIGKDLLKHPVVKKELQAEDAYRRILLPELAKTPKGSAEFEKRVQPLLQGYLKVYGTTAYAGAVVDGVENYKLSAARSR